MKIKNEKLFPKKIREIEKNEKEFLKLNEKKDQKNYLRKSKLILKKAIYVTDDVYKILREEKRTQKKSMAQIICDLIKQTYGKE